MDKWKLYSSELNRAFLMPMAGSRDTIAKVLREGNGCKIWRPALVSSGRSILLEIANKISGIG